MTDLLEPKLIIRLQKKGIWHIIEVEDNLCGMSEGIRKRIFEPFFATKGLSKGTGLGMSVSYFIISDLHNGELFVDSKEREWTRFTIKLPSKE